MRKFLLALVLCVSAAPAFATNCPTGTGLPIIAGNATSYNYSVDQDTANNCIARETIVGGSGNVNKLNVNSDGSITSVPEYTSGAGTPPFFYISSGAANQDSQAIGTAAPHTVWWVVTVNMQTAGALLKIYNTASCTSASTPVAVIPIPGNTAVGGSVTSFPGPGLPLPNAGGSCIRLTQNLPNNDTTAVTSGAISVTIGYQ